MKAGDLESTRFYYLFIKKSVTDNNVRCSLPTWPEEKGHGGRKRTQPAGTLGSQKGREARVTPPVSPWGQEMWPGQPEPLGLSSLERISPRARP